MKKWFKELKQVARWVFRKRKKEGKKKGHGTKRRELAKLAIIYIFIYLFSITNKNKRNIV